SLRWFGAVREAALDLVRTGQVLPALRSSGPPRWSVAWHPAERAGDELCAVLAAAMPPVCAAAFVLDAPHDDAASTLTRVVLAAFVDLAARGVLRATAA